MLPFYAGNKTASGDKWPSNVARIGKTSLTLTEKTRLLGILNNCLTVRSCRVAKNKDFGSDL